MTASNDKEQPADNVLGPPSGFWSKVVDQSSLGNEDAHLRPWPS